MEPIDQPAFPPEFPAAETAPTSTVAPSTGFRRTVLTAGMAAALLVAGGVAAVAAASPDPSSTPSAATTEPSTDGTTTPSTSSAADDTARPDCPNEDGEDGTTDATPTPTS